MIAKFRLLANEEESIYGLRQLGPLKVTTVAVGMAALANTAIRSLSRQDADFQPVRVIQNLDARVTVS